jgi:aminoglycoside phosphotransferase (APT) family kinase protein
MTAVEFGELIDPRPGEQVDIARLEPYLRAHLPKTDGPFGLRQFSSGHANLTYLARFGTQEYVVRRPPLGPVAPSAHDMKREHQVLATLTDVYPLAPRSFHYCGDGSIIGAEFHVMERRNGIAVRGDLPDRFRGDAVAALRLSETIVDALAALHRVKPEDAGLGSLGKPDGYVARQVEGWARRWHAAKDRDLPRVDALVSWLSASVPQPQAATLVHNDFKSDNMLVDPDDLGVARAVLDWDMCTRGDPLTDLGGLFNYWVEAADDPSWRFSLSMPTWREGSLTRAQAAERYARATGFSLDDVAWYHVFGTFKFLVIIQQIYIRYLRGQTTDERFAGFGERVAAMAEKGHALIAKSEV